VDKLVESFYLLNPGLVKAQIKKRILEIAERRQHSDGYGSKRWMVKAELIVGISSAVPVLFTPLKEKKRKNIDVTATNTFKTPGRSSKRQKIINEIGSSGVTTGTSTDTAVTTGTSTDTAVSEDVVDTGTPYVDSPGGLEKSEDVVEMVVDEVAVSSGTLLSYLRSPPKSTQ
jgi:hypothetical protein